MKIGEAKKFYNGQLSSLQQKQGQLQDRLKAQDIAPLTKEEQGVILELSDKVQKNIDATQTFLDNLNEMEINLLNAENAKLQGEAAEEAYSDLGKCIETARRIASGAKVPAEDEQRLMEFSMEMYLTAKNAAMLEKSKSDKEYDSLWEDEEDNDAVSPEDIENQVAEHTVPFSAPSDISADIDI